VLATTKNGGVNKVEFDGQRFVDLNSTLSRRSSRAIRPEDRIFGGAGTRKAALMLASAVILRHN
jgi:hypothetical protein